MKKLILVLATLASTIAALAIPAAASAKAPSPHWCRAGDPPIQTSTRTSCAFAGQALNAYYQGWHGRANVYSPVTHRTYRVTYHARWTGRYSQIVTATGPNGIWLRFGYEL